jgi:coiled-coil and C2 domain-containing protein 2A
LLPFTRCPSARPLGSFSIPFSTILAEKRIEGTFRLTTPSFNYGYVIPGLAQRGRPERRETEPAPGGILGLFGFQSSSRRPREEEAGRGSEQFLPQAMVKEFDSFCTTASSTTFLTVVVTLDPLLISSPYVESDVSISTTFPPDRPLVTYAQLWLQTIRDLGAHTKRRRYMLFGSNSDGLSVLICRYLKPLEPPPGVTTRRACVHIVSLIPFIPDSQAFVGELDLWCTAAQTWQIMGGDEEEHATILYNYLYYLSLKARGEIQGGAGSKTGGESSKQPQESARDRFYLGYPTEDFIRHEELFLAIGQAIPEGNTVYILMRATAPHTASTATIQVPGASTRNRPSLDHTPQGWVLINPVTGDIYSAADPHCPLGEISCLVTPYNIWTNIQKASKPKDLRFDVFQMSHWRPLFGQRFKPNIPGLTPIQSDVLYEPTSPGLSLLCF